MIFLSIDYLLLSFTHSLSFVSVVRIGLSFVNLWSESVHQAQSDFVSKWAKESFIRIRLDAQVALHLKQALKGFHARFVKFIWDLFNLSYLNLEAWILSFLAHISFVNHIVENCNFLLQVALDVQALSFWHLFDCVLLLLQDLDLLLTEGYLLRKWDDFILQLVNWCFEAEGLLTALWCVRH